MTILKPDLIFTLCMTGIFLYLGNLISSRISIFRNNCISTPFLGGLSFLFIKAVLQFFFNIRIILETSAVPLLSALFFATLGWGIGHFFLVIEKLWLDAVKLFILALFIALVQNTAVPLPAALSSMGDYNFTIENPVKAEQSTAVKSTDKKIGRKDINSLYSRMLYTDSRDKKKLNWFRTASAVNLLLAALFGGPAAVLLLKRYGINSPEDVSPEDKQLSGIDVFTGTLTRHTCADQLLSNTILILVFMLVGWTASSFFSGSAVYFPVFFASFTTASVIRFLNHYLKIIDVKKNTDTMNMIGYVSLYFFLIISFMSIDVSLVNEITFEITGYCFLSMAITMGLAFSLTPLFFKNHFAGSCYALGLFSFGFGGGAATLSNVKAFTGRYGFSVNAPLIIPVFGAYITYFVNLIVLNLLH